MGTLDELRRMLGYRPPLRSRPRCQHVPVGRVGCDRPAVVECDTAGGRHRPRYVCGTCSQYQVAILGPLELADEVEVVRISAEGGIIREGRRSRR